MVDEALALRIREVRKDDLVALEWDGEYVHFRRLYRQAFDEANLGRRIMLVAEVEDEIVGQIFIHLRSRWQKSFGGDRTAYLHSFRVKARFRKQGIGGRLLRSAEARLRAEGYNRAVISVAKDNPDALRMYRSHGYEVFTDDPGVWAFRDDQGRLRTMVEPAFVLTKKFV